MLLDPFEEEFHLPSGLVDLGDSKCREGKVISNEGEPLVRFEIEITYAAERVRVGQCRIAGNSSGPIKIDLCRFGSAIPAEGGAMEEAGDGDGE